MRKGLTTIEVLIAVGIMMVLLTVIIFPFRNLNERQALLKETLNVVSVINQARSQTLSSQGGVQHGVHFETNRIVLFSGSSYSSSDPSNISIPLNNQISISSISLAGGGSDVIFGLLNGTTTGAGTVTLSVVASTTQTKTITINGTGIINSNL